MENFKVKGRVNEPSWNYLPPKLQQTPTRKKQKKNQKTKNTNSLGRAVTSILFTLDVHDYMALSQEAFGEDQFYNATFCLLLKVGFGRHPL